MLVKELKKLAREYKIPGRSKMKKKELEKAIEKYQLEEKKQLEKGAGRGARHGEDKADKYSLPKNDCPGDYTRKELVSIAKDCGIKRISKKNMSKLCGEIVKILEKTGEVWRQEKRKRGKRDVIHHIRDEVDIPGNLIRDEVDIPGNLSPIQLVDDENVEKIEIVEDDDVPMYDDEPKLIKEEDIPNHGHWPIHQDEYKTCRVFSNCSKEYSKQNLLDLSVKCGLNIYQRGKRTKTKVQLCNELKDKYGSKKKPKFDRWRNNLEIEKGNFIDLDREINGHYRKPKDFPKKLLNRLRDVGFIVPKYSSPQKVYIHKKKIPRKPSPSREIEMQLEQKDRNCRNAQDLMQYSINEMDKETFIKTAAGYCYDVNDLVQFMIVNRDRNSDPIKKSEKIWNDDMEKATILSHPGLEKEMLEKYYQMLENVQQEKLKRLQIMWDQRDVLQQIGETGFVCLSDQISEFGDEGFEYAPKAIDRLYKIIDKQYNKSEWRKVRAGRIELGQLLDDIPNTCIHGTGMKLSYLFAYFQAELINELGKYVENPLYFPIPNCPYTLSFQIDESRIQYLPDISDSKGNTFTICYYETDESTQRDVGVSDYGRTEVILKREKISFRNGVLISNLKCDVKKYLTKDLWKQFNKAMYHVFSKYKSDIKNKKEQMKQGFHAENETLKGAVEEYIRNKRRAILKYGDISGWDVSNVTDMKEMFLRAYKFNGDLSKWNVSNVTSMGNMFARAKSFNGDLSKWDVSNVTDMGYMFHDAKKFNGDLSKWNASNVTDMGNMFGGAESFNGDLSKWNVSNVTNMQEMFGGAEFNGDLSKWNVSNVTNMKYMFGGSESFDGDLSKWNVSNVTNMEMMFGGITSFNGDISEWNVSNVRNMGGMFVEARSFNGDLSKWNVSNVTDMGDMFRDAESFNGDLSKWNVSNVRDMNGMFIAAQTFNGDLSKWNVSNVTDMGYMFHDAKKFNGDLSKWNVSNVTNMKDMFRDAESFDKKNAPWYFR